MKKLDFLYIGQERTGSTWLNNNLGLHPDIFMPYFKELAYFYEIEQFKTFLLPEIITSDHWRFRQYRRYFRLKYHKNTANMKKIDHVFWDLKLAFGPRTFSWYRTMLRSNKLNGDMSPHHHSLKKETIEMIKEYSPNLKLLITIRHPVERAWSHYKLTITNNEKDPISLKRVQEFIQNVIGTRNDHLQSIKTWSEYFSDIKILSFDELKTHPEKLLKDVFDYLDADPNKFTHWNSKLKKKINVSKQVHAITPEIRSYLEEYFANEVADIKNTYPNVTANWK